MIPGWQGVDTMFPTGSMSAAENLGLLRLMLYRLPEEGRLEWVTPATGLRPNVAPDRVPPTTLSGF